MSIATLKRKTETKYNNMSVNMQQFSLNGGYRNQGYVGQTSLSRSLPRTLMRGVTARGHGGCCGTYKITPIVQSATTSTNNNQIMKSSVLDYDGMIAKKYRWIRRPYPHVSVKPDVNHHLGNESQYVIYKRQKTLSIASNRALNAECGLNTSKIFDRSQCKTVPRMFRSRLNTPQSFNASTCRLGTVKNIANDLKNPQSERITVLHSTCVSENDKEFIALGQKNTFAEPLPGPSKSY